MNRIEEKDNKRKGALLSAFLHLLILLIFLTPCFSFITKKNNPLQSGIIIALGNPNAAEITEVKKEITTPSSKSKSTNTKSNKNTSKKSTSKSSQKVKAVKSQTLQKVSVVQGAKKVAEKNKKNKSDNKSAERKTNQDKLIAKENKRREEERKRNEAEKKRQEKLEAERKAKQNAKSKFSKLISNSDNKTSASKGATNGDPDANVLDGMTSGYGHTGDGLGDRKLLYAPTIKDASQKKGRVVIQICVDKSGKVSKAKYTQRGSSTTDSHLISLAEKSARKYKFDKSNIVEQCGEIIIDFELK